MAKVKINKKLRENPVNERMPSFVFETDLGWTAFAISHEGRNRQQVSRLRFGYADPAVVWQALGGAEEPSEPTGSVLTWIKAIQRYASGAKVDLSLLPVELPPGTTFTDTVRAACRRIPYGQVMTYGQLAMAVGNPGAARAVGNVMRKNPIPLLIPCHRVVGSSGLGGFSSEQGITMKRQLLLMESPMNQAGQVSSR